MRETFTFAWYRFRVTFIRRLASYLSVIMLIGLTGGLAMGSLAAARRTQSSYPTFLTSTNPSTLTMAVYNEMGQAPPAYTTRIRGLPGVTQVRTLFSGPAVPLTAAGAPRLETLGNATPLGSTDGYLSAQDRLAVLRGHLANPASLDQIELTEGAARVWGVHVGERVPMGFYAPAQQNLPGFGTPAVQPRWRVVATVTGIVATNTEIVQDDIDRAYGFVFLTPAMIRRATAIAPSWSRPVYYALQLSGGQASVRATEQRLNKLLPPQYLNEFHNTAAITSTVELAVKPESVALGAFGAIAALICLILSSQALARLLRRGGEDRRILQSMGASRAGVLAEALLGAFGALLFGVVVAILVAFLISPLAPLGPVRAVYPARGFSFDATVLLGGAALLVLVLGVVTVVVAIANAPHRVAAARRQRVRSSVVVDRIRSIGLPVAVALGAHFALESRRDRGDVPVRSILLSSVLAVTLMVATLTFASGLNTLVSRPALYGWNWSFAINPNNDVPPVALRALRHDHDVTAWSGVGYDEITIDGLSVPMILAEPRAKVMPPILSGHDLTGNRQIVLGNQTLSLLDKHVGDRVVVSYGSPTSAPLYIPPVTLRIVGSATFPAVGFATQVADHTAMGTGALVSKGIEPPAFKKAISSTDPNFDGPALVFVRLRPGIRASAGRKNLDAIARLANQAFAKDPNGAGNEVSVLGVQRPAQIVDYHTIGATPEVLAAGLALGAIVALALTLIASVRRRRRDLAIFKTLGLSRGQLAAAVSWQATIDALVGVVVGVPLGILLGRELWTLFARSINAIPQPTVPTLAVVVVGVGTLVVANLAATWPGRHAATTPPGLALRSE